MTTQKNHEHSHYDIKSRLLKVLLYCASCRKAFLANFFFKSYEKCEVDKEQPCKLVTLGVDSILCVFTVDLYCGVVMFHFSFSTVLVVVSLDTEWVMSFKKLPKSLSYLTNWKSTNMSLIFFLYTVCGQDFKLPV